MERPWEIAGKRVVAFSDVHQDIEWAGAILEREWGNYDHVVFMGDLIDSHYSPPRVAGTEATAKFFKGLLDGSHGPATLLLGNHDVPIIEGHRACRAHKHPPIPRNYCSGYSSSTAKKVNKVLDWADWQKFELFKLVNGRLVSHAGFMADFWTPEETVENNLAALYKESRHAIEMIASGDSRFWRCGIVRGGAAYYGGPIWCDFQDEFSDDLLVPQLMGHTGPRGHSAVRQKGKSYCIDGSQSCYALIQPDGAIEFKSISQTPAKTWVEQPVTVTQL